MEFREFLALVWKRRLVVAIVFAAAIVLAAAYAFTQPKQYKASATLIFTPDKQQGSDFIPPDNLSALLSTYAELAKSDRNLLAARQILGRPLPGKVDSSVAGSGVLDIYGTDTSPQGAADTSRAASQALIQSIHGNGILTASLVNPPVAPRKPEQPRPPLILSLAAVLGIIAGVLLALALESFRRSVETPAELSEASGLPVIGKLPRERSLSRSNNWLVWNSEKMLAAQEGYRALRTNIELLTDTRTAVIQVTSSDPGQGKSTVVANLGVALGQLGIPTVIVDADLRAPRQHQIFGLPNDYGLSTLMVLNDSEIVPQPTDYRDLSVLTSGPIPPDPTEMLHIRFRSVLRELRAGDNFVLIDSPPILPVSDARLIAPHTDGVLFVVASGMTKMSSFNAALEKLKFGGAHVMGIVMNFSQSHDENTGYGYGYGHGHEPFEASPTPRSLRAG